MRSGNFRACVLLLLGICVRAASGASQPSDFSLLIEPSSPKLPLGGPIPLSVTLTYTGIADVQVASLGDDFIDLTFRTPPGWIAKMDERRRYVDGRLPVSSFTKGKSVTGLVYLNDFFSKMAPGKTELPAVLKVWPFVSSEAGTAKEPIVLLYVVSLEIVQDSPEMLGTRIAAIASEIAKAKSGEQRLELYRSLAGLSHPSLVPIFLASLLDPDMFTFHTVAMKRLLELCAPSGNWEPVVEYLSGGARRGDGPLFEYWRQYQVNLAPEQIGRLNHAASPWVRLNALTLPGQMNVKGVLASLESEIRDLAAEVARVKKAMTQTKRPEDH